MDEITIKSDSEIEAMREGGKILSKAKVEVKKYIKEGVSASKIEEIATNFIEKSGAKPSFKEVPGYNWTTCINVNDGVVHGIPKKELVFKKGDVVSVDMGVFFRGLHTDSAFTVVVGEQTDEIKKFLSVGKRALSDAISEVRPRGKVVDLTKAMQKRIESEGLNVIKALTGHGVGYNLHEDPRIPCAVSGSDDEQVELVPGMTLAIEVMYTKGKGELKLSDDGWTLSTKDATLSALFEETVAVTSRGRIVLT